MVSYFFILGNNSALSTAEILNKFQPQKYSLVNKEVLRVEFSKKIDEIKVIKKLGGVIKIVELVESDSDDLSETVSEYLPKSFVGKYKFGFSFYGGQEANLKKIAMEVKRELKSRKISCRWIVSKGKNLSSVVVAKNKLIDRGREFIVVYEGAQKYLGTTRAVQDFEELSFRDYNRPARDSHSGMIPPKLAQIMLNIGLQGGTNKVLLDPFCGSGTMLMEAMLLGVENLIGSDISSKAVKNTQKNLEWIQERFNLIKKSSFEVNARDVRRLSQFIIKESIDAIVTEPYLGPQKKVENIEKVKNDLEILYTEAIAEFRKILKKNGRIVMVWPFLRGAKDSFINPEIKGFKIVNQIPDGLNVKLTKRETIIYGRKEQRVWREIITMIKK